jgi:hypothetical protein
MVSTGNDNTDIMMTWMQGNTFGIYYGPLRLPALKYQFDLPSFEILNMGSGSFFGKTVALRLPEIDKYASHGH